MAIAQPGGCSHAIASSSFAEKSQWWESANNSHVLFGFEVLAQPHSIPIDFLVQPRNDLGCRLIVAMLWDETEGQNPSSKRCQACLHAPVLEKTESSTLANTSMISWICTTSHMLQNNLMSWAGWLKKVHVVSWPPHLLWQNHHPADCNHPHDSQSEQPETALHCEKQCLINQPQKILITASFMSLYPFPPAATVQRQHRRSCRKYQTLNHPPAWQATCACDPAIDCHNHTTQHEPW